MKLVSRRTILGATGAAAICLLAARLAGGQAGLAQKPQLAEEVFKNVQVLKGIPVDEFMSTMGVFSAALGMSCEDCHAANDSKWENYALDTSARKRTARRMILMMSAINKDNFGGRQMVTCYSCHRGARNPIAIPRVDVEIPPNSPANSETQKLPINLPTASQLLDNYISALGGTSAIEKIVSSVQQGTTYFRGQSVRAEIFTQAPDKQALVRHLAEGDSRTVFDGQTGWFVMPGHPAREMHGVDMEAARMDADLQFPLHIRQLYPELRVEYPEIVDGREAYVLFGIRKGQPPVKFYFDEQSSLLVRVVRYAESPLGLDPEEIDYADYRAVGGLQTPFRVTVAKPGSTSSIRIENVQLNVPINGAKFAKPPSDHAPVASAAPQR